MSSAAELSDSEAEPGNNSDRLYAGGIPEATVARLPIYLRALYTLAERGVTTVASDELAAELYEDACDFLEANGFAQYEISNFAKPGAESLHNLKYWRREPYAGFGADAHSFDGVLRRQNVESPQEYVARSREGRSFEPATSTQERSGISTNASVSATFGA